MTLATRNVDRLNALLPHDRRNIVLEFTLVCGEESDRERMNIFLTLLGAVLIVMQTSFDNSALPAK
jgi:hypothetical protein